VSTGERVRRYVALAVVLALLALAGIANATVKHHRAAASTAPSTAVSSVVLAHRGSSSAWYCPGPMPLGVGGDRAEIELANLSSTRVRGELVLVTSRGANTTEPVSVGARKVLRVAVPTPARSAFGAASVLLNGLGVGVTEIEHGPSGPVTEPCTANVSSTAYLAGGATASAANIALSLFDPGATPAVANVSFATPSGSVAPPAFQGVSINAGQLVVLNVGQFLPSQGTVATTVSSSGGRIVVGALATNVLAKQRTLAFMTGLASPERSWYLAPAPSGSSATQSYLVLNTSTRPTKVTLRLGSNFGTGTALVSQTVAPGATALLGAARDQSPASLRWGSLTASDGAAIVVERETLIPSALQRPALVPVRKAKNGPLVAPRASPVGLPSRVPPGIGLSTGTPLLAKRWLLGGGESDASASEIVTVANPTDSTVTLHLVALDVPAGVSGALSHLPALQVSPQGALAIDLSGTLGRVGQLTLEVQASTPVSVGSVLYARGSSGSVGFNASAGIPVE
jgi:hypothetical protein